MEEGSADQYVRLRTAAFVVVILLLLSSGTKTSVRQRKSGMKKKEKTFPICHVAREKEALNKLLQRGLEEPSESDCDRGKLDGGFIHSPGRESKLVSDTSHLQIASTPTGKWQWLKED